MKAHKVAMLGALAILQGCGVSSDVNLVKNGVMDFNKTLTVGEALDNWKECAEKSWEEFKTENGMHVVQFTCNTKNVAHFIQQLKEIVRNECEAMSCAAIDVTKMERVFQWSINKDETFQMSHGSLTIVWKDGRTKQITSENPQSMLEDVYANKVTFDSSTKIDKAIAMNLLTGYYSLQYAEAQGGNSPSPKDNPPTINSDVTVDPQNISAQYVHSTYEENSKEKRLSLTVAEPNQEGLVKLNISVGAENCDGEIEGLATLEKNELILAKRESDDEETCNISVKLDDQKAVISEQGCSSYHGALCSFEGILNKNN